MQKSTIIGLLAATLSTATIAQADEFVDDFESGPSAGGWRISGGGTTESEGGNPGAWLHRNNLDTFAPIVRTTIPADTPFVGDYRDMGVTQISFDAQLLFRDWGDAVGFPMSILLRDTKGTPNDVQDDDYAYYAGPDVPLMAEGWVHYDFVIPSESTDAVPEGWSGGWAGDGENFRPGVDWNDVITNVDQVEIWWIHPAWFAILSQWDVGMDNIAIETEDAGVLGDLNDDGVVNAADRRSRWPSPERSARQGRASRQMCRRGPP